MLRVTRSVGAYWTSERIPRHSMIPITAPATYADLKRRVQETLLIGERRIEEAKVLTYWTTGRLIHEHVLRHKEKTYYGKEVVVRLAEDLEISQSVLYKRAWFGALYPIVSARTKLT